MQGKESFCFNTNFCLFFVLFFARDHWFFLCTHTIIKEKKKDSKLISQ